MTFTQNHRVSEYLSEEPCEGKLHAGFCEGSQIFEFNKQRRIL